tara:strand:- start:259 stop:453 length:195 start_codon:yes stop_codon:yes gene_type:complete
MIENKEKDCQGACVLCNSDNLDYGRMKIDGEILWYEYDCNDCGNSGEEHYDVRYSYSTADEPTQ